jgi:excisionase family DNA binding protein
LEPVVTDRDANDVTVTVESPLSSREKECDDLCAVAIVSDGLVTIEQARAFLCVSRGALYNLMDAGELPFVKLGRSRRVPRRAVVELAARALQGGVRR